MREICDQGGAIFFSTHVLGVAEKLCDKIAIIKAGRLIRFGTMEEVKGDDSLEGRLSGTGGRSRMLKVLLKKADERDLSELFLRRKEEQAPLQRIGHRADCDVRPADGGRDGRHVFLHRRRHLRAVFAGGNGLALFLH